MRELIDLESIQEVLKFKRYNMYIAEWIKTRKKQELIKVLESNDTNYNLIAIKSISPILTEVEKKANSLNDVGQIAKFYTTFLYILKGGIKDSEEFELLDIYAITRLYNSKMIDSVYFKEIQKIIKTHINNKEDFLDFREKVINMVSLYRRFYIIKLINNKIKNKD